MITHWPGLAKLLGMKTERPITHCRFSVFPPDGALRVYGVIEMSPRGERWVGRAEPPQVFGDATRPVRLSWACDAATDSATRIRITLAEDRRRVCLSVREGPPFHLDLHVPRDGSFATVAGHVLHTFDIAEHSSICWTYQDWPGVVQIELLTSSDPYIEAPRRCSVGCRLPNKHRYIIGWDECIPCESHVVGGGPAPARGGGFRDADPPPAWPEAVNTALKREIAVLRETNERLSENERATAPLVEALSDILTGNLEPKTLEGAMMRAKTALALTRKPLTKDPS